MKNQIPVVSVEDLSKFLKTYTLEKFLTDLIAQLKHDFVRWSEFDKIPRPAFHVPDGVIELMPTADKDFFTFKYVNGHPKNPLKNKQTIVATGQISKTSDGHPLLVSEMTLLTALRTAATSALATDLLARPDSHTLAILGTGAQSEFQALSTAMVRDIKTIRCYDTDPKALQKFAQNLSGKGFEIILCNSNEEAVLGADIVTVCTACKGHVNVIEDAWIKDGVHINALGGDCPGKTELEKSLLSRTKLVVEFFEQSFIEGEIQVFEEDEAKKIVYAELWEVIAGKKSARTGDKEITLFDSVGFALEDFSALKVLLDLQKVHHFGAPLELIPSLENPKNLFSVL